MDDLLLDSSYLLPIFGIELEYQNFESTFPKLPQRYLVKYNPVSLIEAKWFVLRKSKKKGGIRQDDPLLQRYRTGVLSLQRDRNLQSTFFTNDQIEEISDSLLTKFSIRDYFDRIIYSTAAHTQSVLLTEDRSLHDLFKRDDNDLPKPKNLLRWKDLPQ